MGLLFSFFDSSSSSSSSTTPVKKDKIQQKDGKKAPTDRLAKQERAIAWKKKCQEYEEGCLHPGYVHHPIRLNTMKSSEEYVPSDPLVATLLPGSHKHLGGAFDPSDGCIYGVPASSQNVLVLYPCLKKDSHDDTKDPRELKISCTAQYEPSEITYKMTSIPLPDSVKNIKFKWLRGIFCNGYLYAIPAWAPAVLCVDVEAFWGRRAATNGNVVTLLPLPAAHDPSAYDGQWQWHGAGLNHEQTAIYCIPSNAQKVLKVDLVTQSCSLLDIQADPAVYPNFKVDLHNKWYGGIVGQDNAVYAIPYRSCAVLRIDCTNDTVRLVGPDYGLAGYNWHGGIQVGGKIYAHPSHADYSVLVIDTNDNGRVYELPIARAEHDTCERTNYKWLGGSVGADGNIYCPACDVTACLKIDVTTETCTTFGFAGTLKNKWQGGLLGKDGCIYCIPASGRQVLRMATNPGDAQDGGENPLQLLGDLPSHKDKWQGGYVGWDGNLYLIPENGYRVLKIVTPQSPPEIVNGQLPEGDVTLEMM